MGSLRLAAFSPLLRSPLRPCFTNITLAATPSRSFNLPSFTPQFSSPAPRTLSASKELPFPPLPLFRIISDVQSYQEFLPLLTESTVTARDQTTGYPTQAYLTVGYGPLSETFHSKVECDQSQWSVGARSGEIAFQRKGEVGKDGGVFEYLDTIWKLNPLEERQSGKEVTKVDLSVNFRFKNALHAAMMSAVEDQVAAMMIDAFEKRVMEIGRQEPRRV